MRAVADEDGLFVAIDLLLRNADESGAPMHLALPIAAIRLSIEGYPADEPGS